MNVGAKDNLFFKVDGFFPGEETIFDDFNGVIPGREVESVVGGGNQVVVKINTAALGTGGKGKQAGGLNGRDVAGFEANLVTSGNGGNDGGSDQNKDENGENYQKTASIWIGEH